jgi:ABC-type transport system involved in multi-copper enzyme maturation permease subunit
MLWYKAWLETRSRFLISLAGTVALCSVFVLHGDRDAIYEVGADYYNYVLFAGHQILVMMWALAVTLIMMGGLLRERATGSSAFTLALPVSRTRLMMVRICMGLAQAVVLAIVPWVAMFTVGSIFGKTHSVSQAAYYLMLLLGGGLVFFAMAVLISSLISGEYTAPVVSFGAAVVIAVALSSAALRPYNPWAFMTGSEYLNRQTNALLLPIPWLQAAIYVFLAGLLLALSVRVIQHREF